ncbi:hypothetical protein ILYODFUR_006190 [Ilyodon furcidens]|uniref:Uncharacterized protein n=1 Tax=Ilyodon furcidens TaxID=33524 RepID=A0ABV0TGL7_9TELE
MPRLTDLDRAHPRGNIKLLFRKTKLQHCFGCKTLQLFQARSLSQLLITDPSSFSARLTFSPHTAPRLLTASASFYSEADPSESCERVRRNPSSFVHLFFLIASNSLCAVKLAQDPHCSSSHTDQDCTTDMCNYRKEEPQGLYGHKQGLICLGAARGFLPAVMQVSFACTDHGLKAPRNGEHSKQNATSPNTTSHARARFRTVALIARSLGSFTHRYHHNLKESTAKLTGMKYRYVKW